MSDLHTRIQRAVGAVECEKVMSRHVYWHSAGIHRDEWEEYWSKKVDITWGHGWGRQDDRYSYYFSYVLEKERNAFKTFMGIKLKYPDVENCTRLDGVAEYSNHLTTSPVIEVAEDGKSAKALWQFQAADTRVTACGPLSIWKIGYMAADLVEEDGEFKVLNLLYALDIDHPCAEPWTEPSKYAPDPEFAAFDIPEPQPTVPMEVYRAYSVDRPYQELPKMPVPYTTLAETFSYGI